MFSNQISRLKKFTNQYPRQLWALVTIFAIDRFGGGLLFPFLTLYITKKFHISMTQVGFLFAIYMLGGFFGSTAGGALSDNLGRKITAVMGLVASAACNLLLGFSNDITTFSVIAFFAGIFGSMGHPAWTAMIADLLPEQQRSEGYAILRVAANLSIAIGPAIGGILAGINFMLLFILDAAISLIAAIFLILFIHETLAINHQVREKEPFLVSIGGYTTVFTDKAFMVFILISTVSVLAYAQMNTTLGVYLRDTHSIPERNYGLLISLNAGMVVLFQYAITRRLRGYPPLLVMAFGTILSGLGFSMYGYTTTYPFFLLAMVIITLGEMVIVPVSSSLVAKFSLEEMRGRYMAVYGLSYMIPETLGVTLGGIVMDNFDPRLLWYFTGALALLSAFGYYWMHRHIQMPAGAENA